LRSHADSAAHESDNPTRARAARALTLAASTDLQSTVDSAQRTAHKRGVHCDDTDSLRISVAASLRRAPARCEPRALPAQSQPQFRSAVLQECTARERWLAQKARR
jgi:hypothetical protein